MQRYPVADPGRNEIVGLCLSYPTAAADDRLRDRMTETGSGRIMEIGRRLRDPFWLP